MKSESNNIKVININFDDIKKMIQDSFDFKIRLDTPYGLCKFKPAYGYIFSEYIKDYDWWGYCDIDLIFGDIRKFITEELLDKYEKIQSQGHLCLYKNCKKLNKLFMTKRKDCMYYKDAYTSSVTWFNFDEYPYGVPRIANLEGIKTHDEMIFADLDMFSFTFRKVAAYYDIEDDDEKIVQYFVWKNGKLFDLILNDNKTSNKELIYVHFQKRKMSVTFENNENVFYMYPNEFTVKELSKEELIKKCDHSRNAEYAQLKTEEFANKRKVSFLEKIFSKDRIKRKLFLLKMNKIYKVRPYNFKGGSC